VGYLAVLIAVVVSLFLSFALLALGSAGGDGRMGSFTYLLAGLLLAGYGAAIFKAVQYARNGNLFATACALLWPPFVAFATVLVGGTAVSVIGALR